MTNRVPPTFRFPTDRAWLSRGGWLSRAGWTSEWESEDSDNVTAPPPPPPVDFGFYLPTVYDAAVYDVGTVWPPA